ncbi:putative PEP-binding protein, partial [Kibdelosporangium lantanae]
ARITTGAVDNEPNPELGLHGARWLVEETNYPHAFQAIRAGIDHTRVTFSVPFINDQDEYLRLRKHLDLDRPVHDLNYGTNQTTGKVPEMGGESVRKGHSHGFAEVRGTKVRGTGAVRGTELKGTELRETELTGTELRDAELRETDPGGTRRAGTRDEGTRERERKGGGTKGSGARRLKTEDPGTRRPGTKDPGTEDLGTRDGETKPEDTNLRDTEPGETKLGDAEPKGSQLAGTEPRDAKPTDTQPDAQPTDTEPKETELKETELRETEPGDSTSHDNKTPLDDPTPLGVFVETPAAVHSAAEFCAAGANELFVGTKDLIQFYLAADRGNHRVASVYQTRHPAVLSALRQAVEAGRAAGVPVHVFALGADVDHYVRHLPTRTLMMCTAELQHLSRGRGRG